tara:strand:+ start:342 stop:845 length:504 start_codon:yes stop_codon:yes gene_type:complete
MELLSIDLGCGNNPQNPYQADKLIGIDIVGDPTRDIVGCRVGYESVPLPDSTASYITAFDFIEHVPRTMYYKDEFVNPFINLMNEVYRLLKPGGLFHASTPAFPHPEAFQDPTHVNFITDQTIGYFNGGMKDLHSNEYGAMYGFNGNFKGKQFWNGAHLQWRLTAIK